MKVKRETIIRTICLFIVILNQICLTKGWITFDLGEDGAYEIASSLMLVVVAIWTWWKNNSFTKEAKAGDELMEKLKNENIK